MADVYFALPFGNLLTTCKLQPASPLLAGDCYLQTATRIASFGGRLLGFSLITFGFWQLFSPIPNLIGGLWLILIGWFLNNAAAASYRELVLRTMLEGSRVREVMTLKPETVPADLNLQELIDNYFFNRYYESFPVMENDRPIGMITLNQLKQVRRQDWSQRTVKETMIPIDEIAVSPQQDIAKVLTQMQSARSRRLLVTTDGNLQGIISSTDISNWLQRQHEFGNSLPKRKTSTTEQQVIEMQSS